MDDRAEHTPGPWRLNADTREVFGPEKDRTICRAHLDSSQREYAETVANARLIAAAPEMLGSLELAVELFESDREANIPGSDAYVWLTEARAAIARARGAA